ncbi:putative vacuolar amino acid transporter 1 protein [Zalerion maritima]|uniref:Vacuolar amino acid transporter 1 protein n=1 Tax=Zalerion maritima TaxID=339359 RepID=A0AAD5RZH0_9PEZI|nr:putative vacuolar amino acid transporter 1 protein [Zalerion maritima]
MAGRNPLGQLEGYERGMSPGRQGSVSSFGGRSVQFDDQQSFPGGFEGPGETTSRDGMGVSRNRRSSISRQLGAVVDIGGVNSIRSFTRSWARAAAFPEVIPHRPSLVIYGDQAPGISEGGLSYGRVPDLEPEPQHRTSLIGQSILQRTFVPPSSPGTGPSECAVTDEPANTTATDPLLGRQHGHTYGSTTDFRERERKALEAELGGGGSRPSFGSGSPGRSVFSMAPHLASPPVGSFSSYQSYNTIGSMASRQSMISAGPLWRQQQEVEAGREVTEEGEPLIVKEVEQDGKIVLAVDGQSTLPQTVFNSINTLIGVGLLSLPMGLHYSGWILGLTILSLAALVTGYTARLLSKCMDLDPAVISFSDIAFLSFGSRARICTSVLFTIELLAACVALVVLFADSMNLLFPGNLSVIEWKVVCAALLIPLNFFPLRILSYTSVVGIISCTAIVVIVIVDGFLKPTAPGSLLEVATTHLLPSNWLTLPLSFGLLMSPWGAHSVFPNIYRDMRHPQKYHRALKQTYFFTFGLDAIMAIVGYLMFGEKVHDEITSSILLNIGYPKTLTFLMCVFVAIIPLTKIPLNARPIVSTIEFMGHLHLPPLPEEKPSVAWWKGVARVAIRVGVTLTFLALAILFPGFDSIMAFMGSALCFTICIILPVSFYLRLFGHQLSMRELIFNWSLIIISSILCAIGTVWAFLPKHLIGAK